MNAANVLLAEDEPSTREALAKTLRHKGFNVSVAADGTEALVALNQNSYDVVITDLQMPGADGLAVLRCAREVAPQTLVVVTTAHGSLDTAVEALREGVADYVQKPVSFAELAGRLSRLLEWRQLMWESQALRRQVNGPANVAPFFVGRSHAMQRIISLIMQVSPTHATVLISGESGVGKEVVARAIHHFSQLREEVFLPVNCGAIPDPLVESQLFGHAKGSFTGADSSHEGLFQHAEGGTIFLDEIGELPPHLQVKLLRAIAEKEILPVGTSTPIEVDVRIIASSNRDLRKAVEEGKFREDLYYRLKVVSIEVPPLRDRREDIPPLVQFLVRRHNAHLRRSYKGLENSTLTRLMSAPWRGNVRELEHVIEYAMIVGNGEWIRPCDLPPGAWTDDASTMDRDDDLTEALRRFERAHIENVLRRLSDDRRVAASRLGIDLSTLYRKIRDLDIKNSS